MLPILEANRAHIGPWIPARVAEPAPVAELADRLAGFAAAFAEGREWRYGMFALDDGRMLGELSLFPRANGVRVPIEHADHIEIGYWLRADTTGQGLATEAAAAGLNVATRIPRLTRIEIRCDARNIASAAVPRRLGFVLAETVAPPTSAPGEPPSALQIWTYALR